MHTLCHKHFLFSFSEEPHNKTPQDVMDHLHTWISSLQVHPSHYSRGSQHTRQYLDQRYSTTDLYHHYVEQCQRDGTQEVSQEKFRVVFTHCYNIVAR